MTRSSETGAVIAFVILLILAVGFVWLMLSVGKYAPARMDALK